MTHSAFIKRAVLAVALLTGFAPAAQADKFPYKNPTGTEFPILAWYSILPESNLTRERYEEMRYAGFNLSFSHFTASTQLERGLEASKGTGVKIIATCNGIEDNTVEVVNRFKDSEMLAGWFLHDEPICKDFGMMRAFRDRVYSADKEHLTYLNLLPNIVTPEYLGAESYDDYVQRFVDEVALPQVSFDHYPIVDEDGSVHVRPAFYGNLESVRRVARRNKVPFWAFVLSTAHGPYPTPTTAHMRFEAFSALAYGAQCIQYFTYWTPGRETWDFHNAPISADGRRTHVYYLVRDINNEIQRLAWVFLGADATAVYHTGAEIPPGTERMDTPPAPFTSIEADGEGVLVSQLENNGMKFVMILNRSIDNAQRVTLTKSRAVKRVMPDGTEQRQSPHKANEVTLAPGDYVLYHII